MPRLGLSYPVAPVLTQLGSLTLVKETHRFGTRIEGLQAAIAILESRQ